VVCCLVIDFIGLLANHIVLCFLRLITLYLFSLNPFTFSYPDSPNILPRIPTTTLQTNPVTNYIWSIAQKKRLQALEAYSLFVLTVGIVVVGMPRD
jgi:hypothetical protein